MSRFTASLRTLWSERQARRLMLRRVRSSTRLEPEAHRLTDALEHLLEARSDVALVSEEGWRAAPRGEGQEVAMLVGAVANLSSGLVLRLQLLDGRSFEVLDEVETVIGEDVAAAGDRLGRALAALLSGGDGERACLTRRRDS